MNSETLGNMGYKAIEIFQYIFIPGFFLMFGIGIVMFLLARKNPTKKRKGYLFTLFGLIGVLFMSYGPLLFLYYTNVVGVDTQSIINTEMPLGPRLYSIFLVIAEPILLYLTYFGIGYLLLAAKEPFRIRMGYTLLIGAPTVWVILLFAPKIFALFSGT